MLSRRMAVAGIGRRQVRGILSSPPAAEISAWWDYAPDFSPVLGNDYGRGLPFGEDLLIPGPPVITSGPTSVSTKAAFDTAAAVDGRHVHVTGYDAGAWYINASNVLVTFDDGIEINGDFSIGSLGAQETNVEVDGDHTGLRSFADRALITVGIGGDASQVHSNIVWRRMKIQKSTFNVNVMRYNRSAYVDCCIRSPFGFASIPSGTEAGYPPADLMYLNCAILSDDAAFGNGRCIDFGHATSGAGMTRTVVWGCQLHTTIAAGAPRAVRIYSANEVALVGNSFRNGSVDFAGTDIGNAYVYDNGFYGAQVPLRTGGAGGSPNLLHFYGNDSAITRANMTTAWGTEPEVGDDWYDDGLGSAWNGVTDSNTWSSGLSAPAWVALPGDPNDLTL